MEVCSWENDLYLVIEGENQMMMGWWWDRNVMFMGCDGHPCHTVSTFQIWAIERSQQQSATSTVVSVIQTYGFGSNRSTYGMSRFWSPVLFFQFHPFSISIFHHFVKTKALTSVLQVWSTSPTYPTAHSQPLPLLHDEMPNCAAVEKSRLNNIHLIQP